MTLETFHPKFRQFEVNGPGDDNVLIQHHFGSPDHSKISGPNPKKVYHKGPWRIFRLNDAWVYEYRDITQQNPKHSIWGVFSENHMSIDIYADNIGEERYKNGRFEALTLFQTDQMLFAKLLCDRHGLILHSNGFDMKGKGILLAGESGAGKSTLSRMLKNQGAEILCDDRMFVRTDINRSIIYGNWCHGTVPDTSVVSSPLKAIFFLGRSSGNRIEKLENKREVARNLVRSLVKPLFTPDGWEKTFDFIEMIIHNVPCYKLEFDLSGRICDMIGELLGQKPQTGLNGGII